MDNGLNVGIEIEVVVARDDQAADIDQAILLGAHGSSLAVGEHLAGDLLDVLILIAGLTMLDEPGVFSQAGTVDHNGDVVCFCELADSADVGHGDGLTAIVVAGDGNDDNRDRICAVLIQDLLDLAQVNVALEVLGGAGGVQTGVNHAVHRDRAQDLSVAVERVEMHIADSIFTGLCIILSHDKVGAAALMRRLHIGHAEYFLGGCFQLVEALCTGVALIAEHHSGPLLRAHRRSAGVGQAVHIHFLSLQPEGIVLSSLQCLGTLSASCLLDGLYNFNTIVLSRLEITLFHVRTSPFTNFYKLIFISTCCNEF